MTETPSPGPRPVHHSGRSRSPSYPGINLKQAVERARIVYDHERRHLAPVHTIVAHWGYKNPKSGPATVAYAALKKFGLLIEEGAGTQRQGRLTDLALEIILNPDPSEAIKAAALMPRIHQEMWDEYGPHLPSYETLRWKLIGNRGFTESGVEEFIKEWRATMEFASLHVKDLGAGSEAHASDDTSGPVEVPQGARSAAPAQIMDRSALLSKMSPGMRIPLPLLGGATIILEADFPVSKAAWAQFMAVLSALEPSLVKVDDEMQPQNNQ